MTISELINTRDCLNTVYYDPEEETHPAIKDCNEQVRQLKGKYQISNQALCELLTARTGKKWSFEINEKDDHESDNLFHSGSKSVVLRFFTEGQSLCAVGTHSNARNRELLENVNWFDVILTMQSNIKKGSNVILPTGQSTGIAENNEIIYKTLIDNVGKMDVETLLKDSKTQPSKPATTANKGGEGK